MLLSKHIRETTLADRSWKDNNNVMPNLDDAKLFKANFLLPYFNICLLIQRKARNGVSDH